ncbi:hypothetical protein QBC98_004483 [Kitasatospora acidiphila]
MRVLTRFEAPLRGLLWQKCAMAWVRRRKPFPLPGDTDHYGFRANGDRPELTAEEHPRSPELPEEEALFTHARSLRTALRLAVPAALIAVPAAVGFAVGSPAPAAAPRPAVAIVWPPAAAAAPTTQAGASVAQPAIVWPPAATQPAIVWPPAA